MKISTAQQCWQTEPIPCFLHWAQLLCFSYQSGISFRVWGGVRRTTGISPTSNAYNEELTTLAGTRCTRHLLAFRQSATCQNSRLKQWNNLFPVTKRICVCTKTATSFPLPGYLLASYTHCSQESSDGRLYLDQRPQTLTSRCSAADTTALSYILASSTLSNDHSFSLKTQERTTPPEEEKHRESGVFL